MSAGTINEAPIALVAGWWNSVRNWIEFGREWEDFLHRLNISCLHQTESRKRPGDDWWKNDPVVRHRTKAEAFEIIQRSGAISFAFFTPTDAWNLYLSSTVPEQTGAQFDRPECLEWNGFRFIVQVDSWCLDNHIPMPEFVFESSNRREQEALERVVDRYKLPKPTFRSKLAEDPSHTVVALQAADFLAYEFYRGWKDLMRDGVTSRHFLLAFSQLEHHWGWADKEKMDKLIPVSLAQNRLEELADKGRRERGDLARPQRKA